jgi:anti-sigma regulatory factor (Ser/Thr protein kinase)
MTQRLRLRVAREMGEVRRLNDATARYLHEGSASPASIHDVQLVLEELTTNVIRHATPIDAPLSLDVEVELEPHAVRVKVEDDGDPFDPTTVREIPAPRGPVDFRPGGYGLRIVRRTAVDLRYQRVNDRNVLEMRVPLT